MKFLLFLFLIKTLINCNNKILVLFFSRAGENFGVGKVNIGNTEKFVNEMKSTLPKSTLYQKIEPINQYPISYNDMVKVARKELDNKLMPEVKNPILDISEYNTIIIGYPIWHDAVPRIVINQIEMIKDGFKDKNIILICTHEGSGFSLTKKEFHEKIINAKSIIEGKCLAGSEVNLHSNEIETFAKSIINKYYTKKNNDNIDL